MTQPTTVRYLGKGVESRALGLFSSGTFSFEIRNPDGSISNYTSKPSSSGFRVFHDDRLFIDTTLGPQRKKRPWYLSWLKDRTTTFLDSSGDRIAYYEKEKIFLEGGFVDLSRKSFKRRWEIEHGLFRCTYETHGSRITFEVEEEAIELAFVVSLSMAEEMSRVGS